MEDPRGPLNLGPDCSYICGGTVVGQLAGGFEAPAGMRCAFATVLAIATWDRERSEPEYRGGIRCNSWEVVVPELVFEPGS